MWCEKMGSGNVVDLYQIELHLAIKTNISFASSSVLYMRENCKRLLRKLKFLCCNFYPSFTFLFWHEFMVIEIVFITGRPSVENNDFIKELHYSHPGKND